MLADRLRLLSAGHGLLEGPVAQGNGFLVADATEGRLVHVDADGQAVVGPPGRRGIGGMVCHADGGVVVSGRSVAWQPDEGASVVLLDQDPDRGWCGFNDLAVDRNGRLFVGVFGYLPASADRPRPGGVLRLADGEDPVLVADDIYVPNGIVVDEGRGCLFAVDSLQRCVLRLPLEPADRLTPPSTLISFGAAMPDGMAAGPDGLLWVAAAGAGEVAVVDPAGGLVGRVEVPSPFVTSVAFGGEDRCTVLVTTGPSAAEPWGSIFVGRVPTPAPRPASATVRTVLGEVTPTSRPARPSGSLSDVRCDACLGPWSTGPGLLGMRAADGALLCEACWNRAPTPNRARQEGLTL